MADYAFLKNLFKNEFVFAESQGTLEEVNSVISYFLDASFRWVVFLSRGGMRHKNHTINAHGIFESFLPIRPADRLVGKMWVDDKYVKRDRKFLTWRIEVRNEAGELVARKYWRSLWTDREVEFPKKESYM